MYFFRKNTGPNRPAGAVAWKWRLLCALLLLVATVKTEARHREFPRQVSPRGAMAKTDSCPGPVWKQVGRPPRSALHEERVCTTEEKMMSSPAARAVPFVGGWGYRFLLTFLMGGLFLWYGWWTVNAGHWQLQEPPGLKPAPEPALRPGGCPKFTRHLQRTVEAHAHDPGLTARRLCRLLHLTYPTCLRRVKAATGMTISEYIKHVRIRRAAALLREQQERTIATIAYETGFASNAHFSREFKKEMGCTPST